MPHAVLSMRRSTPALFVLLFAPGGVSAPVAALEPAQAATPQLADELPASPLSIDGREVPWTEFAGWIARLQGRANAQRFALDWLLEREARAAGVRVEREELLRLVDAEIEQRVRDTFGGDRAPWLAELERLGLTPEIQRAERIASAERQNLLDELVRRRRVLGPDEVRELWEARYGPGGRRLHVSRLFLRVTPPEQRPGTTRDQAKALGEAAKRETLERAEALHGRLLAGADFARLARELSDDEASRGAGGRLDEPLEPADWPGLESEDLRGLELGALLPPFHSRGGYNLLRVDAVEITPLETVAAQLELELAEAPADMVESQLLGDELLADARIELLPELDRELELDRERLQRPVLVIDGNAISRLEFTGWLMRERGRPLLRTFMQHRRVAERAAAAGLEPTSVEVEQRMQEDLEQQLRLFFKGDRQAWLDDLRAKGQSPEDYQLVARMRTRHNLRAERLLLTERVVTPELVRAAWEERYGEGGQSLDVRYILRRLPAAPEGSLETDEEVAAYVERETRAALAFLDGLRERVAAGEDFAALARTYSEEPESRDLGGRPPQRFELHTWPQDLQAQLRALSPGGVAEPVQMGTTFLLFELAGRKHVPLEEVEDELTAELRTRRPSQVEISGWVNQFTSAVVVEPLPGLYR